MPLVFEQQVVWEQPLAVLESFRLGIPVLGAKIGGIPELVQDGINGMLFESLSLPALVSAATKLWS